MEGLQYLLYSEGRGTGLLEGAVLEGLQYLLYSEGHGTGLLEGPILEGFTVPCFTVPRFLPKNGSQNLEA